MSNLSAGVQILIDQLKENPDAFFSPMTHDPREVYVNPRFSGWRHAIEEEIIGVEPHTKNQIRRVLPATWFLSEDEKEALADAYLQAKRQRFDAEVIFTLNAPPEEPQKSYTFREAMRLDSSGTLGISATAIAPAIQGGYANGNR